MNGIEVAALTARILDCVTSLNLPNVEWSVDEYMTTLMELGSGQPRISVTNGMVHSQKYDVVYYPFCGYYDPNNDVLSVVKTEPWAAILVYDVSTGSTQVQTVDCEVGDSETIATFIGLRSMDKTTRTL